MPNRLKTPGKEYASASEIAGRLDVDPRKVKGVIKELAIIGLEYTVGRRSTVYYSPEEQQEIENHLGYNGDLLPRAPEGYLPVSGIAKKLKAEHNSIKRIIKELGDAISGELCKTPRVGAGGRRAIYYSPEDQYKIEQRLLRERRLSGRR